MESISSIEKIKLFWNNNDRQIALIAGVTLVALISFGAGYLTANNSPNSLVITERSTSAFSSSTPLLVDQNTASTAKGIIVASKSGKVYHWPWSSWAKKIKPENQVWFNSEAEAQSTGYKASSEFVNEAPSSYKFNN
ncbi:MAG: hypothetical protein COU81_02715 [Candidatus Portnoybacteria bacterium CG10_big_fil_rev_8_21_14_0_10_36_7]|uniref:Uncharacterized protein n=1 Tax=Candidatus Portnoybacteria bacterium CG10_big_fil_rev_8_21_14_0_10_36_7 TaxID=1974812 RepID=A0A2M8KDS5_9BACT|nr:MAG: hypothetical protein COU81_02715 [Candidatus Portnoybacteria bacterium CG10_big_fil_rev_8_21_14_0_10_36_7]